MRIIKYYCMFFLNSFLHHSNFFTHLIHEKSFLTVIADNFNIASQEFSLMCSCFNAFHGYDFFCYFDLPTYVSDLRLFLYTFKI